MTEKLKIITRDEEITMAIELKIRTSGTREEFEDTYTRSFLEDNGLVKFDPGKFAANYVWGIHTEYDRVCSFSSDDILTYMSDGTWDLRAAKEDKEKSWL